MKKAGKTNKILKFHLDLRFSFSVSIKINGIKRVIGVSKNILKNFSIKTDTIRKEYKVKGFM